MRPGARRHRRVLRGLRVRARRTRPTRSWWSARAAEPVYAACVVLATHRLDVNRAVKGRFGRKSSFASPDETKALTGHEIGGVTVFGLPADLPIWVDAAVMGRDRIVLGGGSRSWKVIAPSSILLHAAERRGRRRPREPGAAARPGVGADDRVHPPDRGRRVPGRAGRAAWSSRRCWSAGSAASPTPSPSLVAQATPSPSDRPLRAAVRASVDRGVGRARRRPTRAPRRRRPPGPRARPGRRSGPASRPGSRSRALKLDAAEDPGGANRVITFSAQGTGTVSAHLASISPRGDDQDLPEIREEELRLQDDGGGHDLGGDDGQGAGVHAHPARGRDRGAGRRRRR